MGKSQKVCEFPGCGREHNARGLCTTHYMQMQKGKPLTPVRAKREGCLVPDCLSQHQSKAHTPGQRVEDKIQWALEVLSIYRPEVLVGPILDIAQRENRGTA